MYDAHPTDDIPDPPYVAPVVKELAKIMGRYTQKLNQILWHAPYTAAQIAEAIASIQATHNEIAGYEERLSRTIPGSTRQPKVAAWFGYHRQTLEQAYNIYQGIARSLNQPSGAPPAAPPVAADADPAERMRRLLGGCCIHCEEHLGAALYTVAICPRCGRYPTR
ncbi:hypothetical protein [Frankia sp. Cas3]|uniref:hypothetical protein n=1 Tax=Frankia sp. Cas3 TaxID=3073926 RepID=UPI002AD22B33|nr:hypothetical protein [Frankia sp. Cas3]